MKKRTIYECIGLIGLVIIGVFFGSCFKLRIVYDELFLLEQGALMTSDNVKKDGYYSLAYYSNGSTLSNSRGTFVGRIVSSVLENDNKRRKSSRQKSEYYILEFNKRNKSVQEKIHEKTSIGPEIIVRDR